MADVRIASFVVTMSPGYKPGDPAPAGYLDWHAWAEVQHKAGLRQSQCCDCSLWRYPQEMSTQEVPFEVRMACGKRVRISEFRCLACAEKQAAKEAGDA
jgi:hypothetical protein